MADEDSSAGFGAYGDFWIRYLNWGVRHCPWTVEPILVTFYAGLFFVAAKSFREGIAANVRVLFPNGSRIGLAWKVYRVFWNFAAVAVDGVRAREEPGIIEWEIDGIEAFEQMKQCESGVILITAHMGNYDLAGSVFAQRFDRIMHAVRAPERNPELQAVRNAELKAQQDEHYRIVYNEPGNMLAITLAQALQRQEAVAIQADRILFDVAPMTMEWDEQHTIDVPQGPFILSLTTGCPIYPLFMIRLGRCRYRVEFGCAFHCERTGRDKQADLKRAAKVWVNHLREIVKRHWSQWLVVEQNLRPESRS